MVDEGSRVAHEFDLRRIIGVKFDDFEHQSTVTSRVFRSEAIPKPPNHEQGSLGDREIFLPPLPMLRIGRGTAERHPLVDDTGPDPGVAATEWGEGSQRVGLSFGKGDQATRPRQYLGIHEAHTLNTRAGDRRTRSLTSIPAAGSRSRITAERLRNLNECRENKYGARRSRKFHDSVIGTSFSDAIPLDLVQPGRAIGGADFK
jgi:hypothetical protein